MISKNILPMPNMIQMTWKSMTIYIVEYHDNHYKYDMTVTITSRSTVDYIVPGEMELMSAVR